MKNIILTLLALAGLAQADTLGVVTQGDQYANLQDWVLVQSQNVVCSHNGTANRLYIYTSINAPSTNYCKLSVYSGYSNGAILIATGTLTNATPGQWNYIDVNFSVVEGNTYCITLANGSHGISFLSSGGSWHARLPEFGQSYASQPEDPLGNTEQRTQSLAMYIQTTNDEAPVGQSGESNIVFTVNGDINSNGFVTGESSISFTCDGSISTFQNKLLAIGNSNTYGHGSFGAWAYRKPLQDYIGVSRYDFVGPYQSFDDGIHDIDHAGLSGDSIQGVLNRLPDLLDVYIPSPSSGDIVNVMIGTNDVNLKTDTTTYYTNMIPIYGAILDSIHAHSTSIRTIAATVPPTTNTTTNVRAAFFNNQLRTLINSKIADGYNITIAEVDAYVKSNPNYASEWYYDELHPNDTCHKYGVANAFYDAITDGQDEVDGITQLAFTVVGSVINGAVYGDGNTNISFTCNGLIVDGTLPIDITGESNITFTVDGDLGSITNSDGAISIDFSIGGTLSRNVSPPVITLDPVDDTTTSQIRMFASYTGYQVQVAWYKFKGTDTVLVGMDSLLTYNINSTMHNDSFAVVAWNDADTVISAKAKAYVVYATFDSVNAGDSNTIYVHGNFLDGSGWTGTLSDSTLTTESGSETAQVFGYNHKITLSTNRYHLVITNGDYTVTLYIGRKKSTGNNKPRVSLDIGP